MAAVKYARVIKRIRVRLMGKGGEEWAKTNFEGQVKVIKKSIFFFKLIRENSLKKCVNKLKKYLLE